MTPFKKNVTKSIDNLNRICKTILSVYDNKTIDKMLTDNVLNQTGSDLTFNNTVAGGKFDWEIQGKCEQDTTTGKNLLNSNNTSGYDNYGIVVTPLTEKTYKVNGTASTNVNYNVNSSFNLPEGTYILNGCPSGIAGISIQLINSNDQTQGWSDTGNGATFTIAEETTFFARIRINNGTNISNLIFKPMIRLSSVTDDSYEPYTNGASPNPDYPQPIRVVTGDNEVVVQNKNFLKESVFTKSGNNYQFYKNDLYLLKAGVTYTASYSGEEIPVIYFAKPVSGYYVTITGRSLSYTPPEDQLCFIQFTRAGGLSENIIDYQLEYGDTATTHVPHAEQKVTLHNVPDLAGFENTDYVDTIEGKTDDWKVVRKVKKINGDDYSWTFSVGSLQGYTSAIADIIASQYSGCFCNIGLNNNITQATNSFYVNSGKSLVFRNPTYNGQPITTSNDFNTYIKAIAIFYVKLATPTEKPITDTTLINDLNNMYNLMGYDGQTNISIIPDTGNAQGTLKVTGFVTEKEGD